MKLVGDLLKRFTRMLAIVLLVVIGSTVLVRFAPGYFSDVREMDPRYARSARAELSVESARSNAIIPLLSAEVGGWLRGNAGISRQYDVPVLDLILPRLAVTGSLMLRSIALAWTLALCASLLSSAGPHPSLLWQMPATLLLAIPTAAMATMCLLAGSGGPVLVMSLLLAARDFKFLDRILRKTWLDPHLLYARTQGIGVTRLIRAHILPSIASQLSALATLSIVTALGALAPVEVIFNVPGVGQLAWSAALNRDLPVLLTVTMLMALAVTFAGVISDRPAEWKNA
ncbi:peptide/nickel transport system permease protein [Silvibacterium bohemicum]|uniref:Peptide/nickel transport system permease protein n=1 Tax=Silvibacterium bohemicum TaxID=1577686 RepID=A0A841JML8_9BACT|nr:ABC transporter permease subunit [Silvibacterium bohemicum]MBB6142622.1 peptide/nickel transport system permease protein [Silvibacterium bohemicum]